MLTEPDWDGVIRYEDDDDGNIRPIYEDPDGNETVYGYEDTDGDGIGDKKITRRPTHSRDWDKLLPPEELIDNRGEGTTPGRIVGEDMVAGSVANKNPIITNTGKMDEWVAAKITFVYADGADAYYKTPGRPLSDEDFQKVLDIIRIDWTDLYASVPGEDTGSWYYAADHAIPDDNYPKEMIFYYDKIVKPSGVNSVTNPIFTKVSVIDDATEEQIEELYNIGGFAIYIEGYAIQYSAFENGSAWVSDAVYNENGMQAVFVSGDWSDFTAYVAGNGITRSGS